MKSSSPAKPYPGRDRVFSREAVRDVLFREYVKDGDTETYPCEAPRPIHVIGLPSMFDRTGGPLTAEVSARCRRCGNCLAHRRRLWTARAMDEIAAARRTWFGTLTFHPEAQFVYRLRAEAACQKRRREAFSSLDAAEQFKYLVDHSGPEVTKFMKRVRKRASVPLRYLLVSERHKSGDPHFHLLLHEPREPVRKRLLEECWQHGFSHWRLVERDRGAATYACKYLAKEAETRVRASKRYGQAYYEACVTERLQEATRIVAEKVTDADKSPNQ